MYDADVSSWNSRLISLTANFHPSIGTTTVSSSACLTVSSRLSRDETALGYDIFHDYVQ